MKILLIDILGTDRDNGRTVYLRGREPGTSTTPVRFHPIITRGCIGEFDSFKIYRPGEPLLKNGDEVYGAA